MRLIIFVFALISGIGPAAADEFDGRYSGDATVTTGDCPAFTIEITITNSHISGYAESPRRRAKVTGRVGPGGRFEGLTVTGYADGAGHIKGDRVSGTWRNAETGCEGALSLIRNPGH